VKQDKLETALNKYDKLKQHFAASFQQLQQWRQHPAGNEYKKRFLVKRGTDYISIKTEDIAYFYAAHKLVCMVDNKGQKFILDQSLADIEKQLDPSQFYRVNRKYLVHLSAIKKIKSYPKSKLQLEMEPPVNEDVVVSQENVAAFKHWMGQ
jgi:two-component system LytT family response regulator